MSIIIIIKCVSLVSFFVFHLSVSQTYLLGGICEFIGMGAQLIAQPVLADGLDDDVTPLPPLLLPCPLLPRPSVFPVGFFEAVPHLVFIQRKVFIWNESRMGTGLEHNLWKVLLVDRGRELGGAKHRDLPVAVTRRNRRCIYRRG